MKSSVQAVSTNRTPSNWRNRRLGRRDCDTEELSQPVAISLIRLNHASRSGRRNTTKMATRMGSLRTLRCPRTLALNLPPLSLSTRTSPFSKPFKMSEELSEMGLIGLAVMGGLALNIADHGFAISVYNRTTSKTEAFLAEIRYSGGLLGCRYLGGIC